MYHSEFWHRHAPVKPKPPTRYRMLPSLRESSPIPSHQSQPPLFHEKQLFELEFHHRQELYQSELNQQQSIQYIPCIWLFLLSRMFTWDLFILLSASGVCFLLELRSIPFYKYTTICLFIPLLMDTWVASNLWLLWIKAAINILC